MAVDRKILDIVNMNKTGYEIFQQAIVNSVATLIYSEFIANFKKIEKPVLQYRIPALAEVEDLLRPDNKLMRTLSETLFDNIDEKYIIGENMMDIFTCHKDLTKVLLDKYIIPNSFKQIPAAIRKKFNLENNQDIHEDWEIDMFDHHYFPMLPHIQYLVNELMLQYIDLDKSIKKKITKFNNNSELFMLHEELMINSTMPGYIKIANYGALCPIIIDQDIQVNGNVFDLLRFVSSTEIIDEGDSYRVRTENNSNIIDVVSIKNTL